MRDEGVEGRVLADDIMLIARGTDHARKFERALNLTHDYIRDMGGKIAPAKSTTFSSCDKVMQWLKISLVHHGQICPQLYHF